MWIRIRQAEGPNSEGKRVQDSSYPTGLYNKMQQKYIIFIIISKFFQTGSEKRRPFLVKCVYSLLVLWSVPSLTFLLSPPLDSENFNLTNSKFQTKVPASEKKKKKGKRNEDWNDDN